MNRFPALSNRLHRFQALLLGCACLLSGGALSANEEFASAVAPFLEAHCFKCHDAEKQKGDLRLDTVDFDLTQGENAVLWQDVSDLLITGDMPPEDEPRPPSAELSQVIKAIDTELRAAAESMSEGSRIAIRRLSRAALDNTVKDLLGINLLLSENLPADPELEGFDSLAATLDANPELVLKLQSNAQALAQQAISDSDDIRQNRLYPLGKIGHGNNVQERDGYAVIASSRDRKYVLWPQGFVVPQDGTYRVRVKASAGDLRWDLEAQGIEYTYLNSSYEKSLKNPARRKPNDELRLASIIAIQAEEARHMDAASVPGRRVGFFYVGSKEKSDVVEVRLKAGENIMIHYASGAELNQSPIARVGEEEMLVADLMKVKELEVSGPILDTWPSAAHHQLLGNGRQRGKDASVEGRIEGFLYRAFRRPVPESTVQNFLRLYQAGLDRGFSEVESMRYVVEGVLCSPRFLFNHDKGDGKDAWAIANRLSYFLWNSMPDEALLRLAEKGQLLNPKVIQKQARRMLEDPKAERFVTDFTAQWLGLKNIELMKPDPKLYKTYDPLLEGLLRRESEVFFAEVLNKNLPIADFLDSEFVMINERLAEHYGIEGVTGNAFRKVALTADSPRGGLLGQASILKLTSNGTRTSPVIRGIWILENILGTPPAAPPSNVEPLEPDVRGAKTIYEMLAKHREVEACADCHKSIDPWGFGLEHFDAIGSYRESYRNGKPVYAKGSVPGASFDNHQDMKQVLLERRDQFARALTEKLFTYALGHPLAFAERIASNDLAAANLENGDGFKDLILDICSSPLFRGELANVEVAKR